MVYKLSESRTPICRQNQFSEPAGISSSFPPCWYHVIEQKTCQSPFPERWRAWKALWARRLSGWKSTLNVSRALRNSPALPQKGRASTFFEVFFLGEVEFLRRERGHFRQPTNAGWGRARYRLRAQNGASKRVCRRRWNFGDGWTIIDPGDMNAENAY